MRRGSLLLFYRDEGFFTFLVWSFQLANEYLSGLFSLFFEAGDGGIEDGHR